MTRVSLGFVAAFCALAACQQTGGLAYETDSPFAPSIDTDSTETIDGLIVGHRLMAAGEFELALKAYYRAASIHGTTAQVLSSIGSANLRLGRLGQAERQLRQALKREPEFVPAWNNLGVVLMEQGSHKEAMLVFRRAVALDSGESDSIRENLRLAIEKSENPFYDENNGTESDFKLVRRGASDYLILPTP